MRRAYPLCLLLLGAAAVFPAAAPAAPKAARFNVTLTARQMVEWSEDLRWHGCGGGEFRTIARGDSMLVFHTPGPQALTARLVRNGGREIELKYKGGPPVLPVRGTLTRYDPNEQGIVIHPGTPGACPPPENVPPDCGQRNLPPDARVALNTEYWDSNAIRHPFDRLSLGGPNSQSWLTGPDFRHCLSMGRDDVIAGPGTGSKPILARLPVRSLFGKRRRFTVHGLRTETVDHMAGTHSDGLTGVRPTVTTTEWKLSFNRIRKGHR